MARRLRFKPSLRTTMLGNAAYIAAMTPGGLPSDLAASMARSLPDAPKPRAEPKRSSEPMERDIQRAIIEYLERHPLVAFIGRFNNGAVQSNNNGHASYVRFNTIKGFPDLHGCTKQGRAIYIEVKRPGKKPTEEQAAFLAKASSCGAISGYVSSIEEVETVLANN